MKVVLWLHERAQGAQRQSLKTAACRAEVGGGAVAFTVESVFFVIVLGVLDARLPWPRVTGRGGRS